MSLLKYVIYLLPTIIFNVECTRFRSDYNFDNDTKMWYKLHTLKRSWHDARLMCELEGATLLSPDNEPLKQLLNELAIKHAKRQLYVAIHSTFAKGVWHSLDGKPLSIFEDLYTHSFDFSDTNQCAVLDNFLDFLQGVDCSLQYSFVCYKHDADVTEETVCGTTDEAYTLDNRTGNCYKFHSNMQTWRDAYEICYAEEAHLAVIDDITEAEVLSDILKKHQVISEDGTPESPYIGIVDWRKNGEWYSIKGVPLKKSGYSNWATGEPNNINGDEFCAIFYDNGKFNDISCETKKVFICEKNSQKIMIPKFDYRNYSLFNEVKDDHE